MLLKRFIISLIFLLGLWGQLYAIGPPKVGLDSWGKINSFWLVPNESEGLVSSSTEEIDLKHLKPHSFNPKTIYSFTREVTTFDIKTDNNFSYLAHVIDQALYLTYSKDDGQNFSPAALIAEQGNHPSLVIKDELLAIAWEQNNQISYIKSVNGGMHFSEPKTMLITDEVLSSPKLLLDQEDNLWLCFLAQQPTLDLTEIKYTSLASPEPITIFNTHDKVINLQIATLNNPEKTLIIFWQNEYLERVQSYYSISLDQGNNFSQPKLFDFDQELLALGFIDNKFCAISFDNEPKFQEIRLTPPPAPQIVFPQNDIIVTTPEAKIKYIPADDEPKLYKIEFSRSENFFHKYSFEHLTLSLTQDAVEYDFSAILSEGEYFVRIYAFDGFYQSEASETVKFRFNINSPTITVLNPQNSEWFKPESTIFIEANIFDQQDDIADEALGQIMINGILLESLLFYDKEEAGLFGFIDLPANLPDGQHQGTLSLNDSFGNTGLENFMINIDNSPPTFNHDQNRPLQTTATNEIILPLADQGAGLDLVGTMITIAGVTFEGQASVEGKSLIITMDPALALGTYEVNVVARDLIGNIAQPISFCLVVDPTQASSIIVGNQEDQPNIIQNCFSGPNPFSPGENLPGAFSTHGKGMVFSYSIAQPADLKIRIYDITGTLIWVREMTNAPAGSGVTAWSGVNQFGQLANNGIYPYVFSASANGATEIRRGKVVIVK